MLQRRVYASHRRMRQIKCPTLGIGSKVREELWTQHFSQIIDALVGEEIVIPLPIELLSKVAPRAQGSGSGAVRDGAERPKGPMGR